MAREQDCSATQLIDGNGVLNVEGLNRFIAATGFASCGRSYRVVAIMGPQSSGKSTLLNSLFQTNFKEMDADWGRTQTTKGIWIAKCSGIEQPFTIAMDLEGSDGKKGGEDDTAFKKHSTLFTVAIADIVLINMWYHAIGLDQATKRPLLKTVFQVMMHLSGSRKRKLLFVIRDHGKMPLEHLKSDLRRDIQKIWDEVSKPHAHENTLLSDLFNVEVTALPHYEYAKERFEEKVAQLRQQFFDSTSPIGPASDGHKDIPASGFSFSAQDLWKTIKENKDLDLPAHKVMVATVRCEEIGNEIFSRLASDERWLELENDVRAGVLVSEFRKKISTILERYFSDYDRETSYFDEGIRNAKRRLLESKALNVMLVYPTYAEPINKKVYSQTLENVKIALEKSLREGEDFAASVNTCNQSSILEFDTLSSEAVVKQGNWNESNVWEKHRRGIGVDTESSCDAQLSERWNKYEWADNRKKKNDVHQFPTYESSEEPTGWSKAALESAPESSSGLATKGAGALMSHSALKHTSAPIASAQHAQVPKDFHPIGVFDSTKDLPLQSSARERRSKIERDQDCSATQMIDGNGVFNVEGLDRFIATTGFASCGRSYRVVAIMGPQSSGKSTLLNSLFHTNFKEMVAHWGRSQTTNGIWIAKCIGIEQPFTVAMDLEGIDGKERGEDDTAFEKQSALFALAVADVVLINIWCNEIGREQAGNRPLFRTVFQAMMRLFNPRKITLLFVIRDKTTKTSHELLEVAIKEDIQKIWDEVPKSRAQKSTLISEFFNVEVAALPSYEEKEEEFKEQVAHLRQRFFHSTPLGGFAGDRHEVVPASGFSFSAQQIWKTIKEDKDLDLPAIKVMVANVRCEEIGNEMLKRLSSDEGWLALQGDVQAGAVSGFGRKLSTILEAYLSQYEEETSNYHEGVRNAKGQKLKSRALDVVYPAYATLLEHICSQKLENFKTGLNHSLSKGEEFSASVCTCSESCILEFDKLCADASIRQANWDASNVREKLQHEIRNHAKLLELMDKYEKQLSRALSEHVGDVLKAGGNDTWAAIRKLLQHETLRAKSELLYAAASFKFEKTTIDAIVQKLRDYARTVVETKAREEAANVLIHMWNRFSEVFNRGIKSKPPKRKKDIKRITNNALSESLKILSDMAAIRLDGKGDEIEKVLFSSLMEGATAAQSSQNESIAITANPLLSSTWEGVSPEDTLIAPVQCKSLWKQFIEETKSAVSEVIPVIPAQRHERIIKATLRAASILTAVLTAGLVPPMDPSFLFDILMEFLENF